MTQDRVTIPISTQHLHLHTLRKPPSHNPPIHPKPSSPHLLTASPHILNPKCRPSQLKPFSSVVSGGASQLPTSVNTARSEITPEEAKQPKRDSMRQVSDATLLYVRLGGVEPYHRVYPM